jgi:hypothetical protein
MNKVIKPVADLGIAAYLLMHGYDVAGKKGRTIYFEVSDDEGESQKFDKLSMEYLSSPYHRFDHCIMSLKKVPEYKPE